MLSNASNVVENNVLFFQSTLCEISYILLLKTHLFMWFLTNS